MQNALDDYAGWISGVRRDQSRGRAETDAVEHQWLPSGRTVLKVHPLAHVSRAEVETYLTANRIETHPLLERGFASIGCWPCTAAVGNGKGERAGRWPGMDKTECGIHTFGNGKGGEGNGNGVALPRLAQEE